MLNALIRNREFQRPQFNEIIHQARACGWEDIGFFPHRWSPFHVREYIATITVGDEPVTNPDRKLLAAELRDHVAEKFVRVL